MPLRIELPREQIAEFCQRWGIIEFAFFGSVLRDDFGPESDIDVLVQFGADAGLTLFDIVRMEDELRELFGREVDLADREAVEQSRNHIRRNAILAAAETVYAA